MVELKEIPSGGGITSVVYKLEGGTIRKRLSIPCPNLVEQEARALQLLQKVCPGHFPKLHRYSTDDLWLDMEDVGECLNHSVVPDNWASQCTVIAEALANCGIYHKDLRPSNILIKDKTISLIDFIDIKECKQGIRPTQSFFEFEAGKFYLCEFIGSSTSETKFVFNGQMRTTLTCFVDIIRTKDWKSQEEELKRVIGEFVENGIV